MWSENSKKSRGSRAGCFGDYTYYDDFNDPSHFDKKNVLYNFDPEQCGKLIIGKFCAIAHGVKFLMNGANHNMDGITTYPFHVFQHGWEWVPKGLPNKGDTVIGNGVLIGYEAIIMPGVKIGDGTVIGARSVVYDDVGAYHIVRGNPAKKIRKNRFTDKEIKILLKIKIMIGQVTRFQSVIFDSHHVLFLLSCRC